MNAPVEDDRSSAGPKYIFERREEKKIRRRLISSAFFFDVLAVALVISLCVGGWTRSNSGWSGNTMSRDSHLVTWSVAYRRNATGLESTFVMSWFLSSKCYMEANRNDERGQGGCIHRIPGSPFDLKSIMADVTTRLIETDNSDTGGNGDGAFEGLENIDLSAEHAITSSRDALACYIIFLAINLGVWLWHGIVKRNSIKIKSSSWRAMAGSQIMAAIALLVASAMTTAAAYKADGVLNKYEDVFKYHSIGSSFAMITWCAFISHLLGLLAYVTSVLIWERLQQPELYPPEPEPEPGSVPPGASAGRLGNERHRREAPVHREHDPNSVDDELPPYSRVDPNGMSIGGRERRRASETLQEPSENIELGAIRNQGHTQGIDLDVPAPDYELHERPSNRGA